jgi:hypothetical protein
MFEWDERQIDLHLLLLEDKFDDPISFLRPNKEKTVLKKIQGRNEAK